MEDSQIAFRERQLGPNEPAKEKMTLEKFIAEAKKYWWREGKWHSIACTAQAWENVKCHCKIKLPHKV